MESITTTASFMLGFIVSVSVAVLLVCLCVWQRPCGILCRKWCDRVRRAWRRRWLNPMEKRSSTSSEGEFSMVHHHVPFGSDVGQNFSPLIKLPGKAVSRPAPSRVSYTPEGRPTRRVFHQQFRIKDNREGRNDSVSRSSMVVTGTRSFGTFGTLFSGHSYPSVVLGTSIHGSSVSYDGNLPEIHRNVVVTADTSSSSFSSALEDNWSTSVLARSPEMISSTPIKL